MPAAIFPVNARRNATSKLASAPHRKNAAPAKPDSLQQPDRSAERNNPVQKLIKQAVDSLIQQLEAGRSDALIAYLAAMARFHRYSFGNILAIARQCPAATRVAGYQTWKELGRQVKKGEKGIQIFAPMIVKRRKKDSDDLETEAHPHSLLIGFRPVYVWERLSRDLRPGFCALDTARGLPQDDSHGCHVIAKFVFPGERNFLRVHGLHKEVASYCPPVQRKAIIIDH